MNTEIINIGDELLIGQVVNTNASWMAEQLNLSGLSVKKITVIGDTREDIMDALQAAGESSEVVLISGGIGPTRDDITRTTLCEFFNTRLVFSEDAYRDIETLFASRGYLVTELNRLQAMIPEGCRSIPNRLGTARGMWFEKEFSSSGIKRKTIFISMPGVPFEMQSMMKESIIPELKERFRPGAIYHKTILTQGLGESFLAKMIEEWEDSLPESIRLAYLPQPGLVRLRLSGKGEDEEQVRALVDEEAAKLISLIPEYYFGEDEDRLEEIVGRLLKEKGWTLGTAESCTGGYIAHLLTGVPGSSAYFRGAVVAYDNKVKEEMLGVPRELIEREGAVSGGVVSAMAAGLRAGMKVDCAIAVSGIAGPDGGSAEKPVGTVCIAVATPLKVHVKSFLFGDSRERNIRRTALTALNLLRKMLLGTI